MKLATIDFNGKETSALVLDQGCVALPALNRALETDWPADLLSLLESGRLDQMTAWYNGQKNGLGKYLQHDLPAGPPGVVP